MAKKSRKKSARKGHPQRARFKAAAKKCAAQVRDAGITAFSREQWTTYGKCMKKSL